MVGFRQVPPELGFLNKLQRLVLAGNQLSGTIADSILDLPSLTKAQVRHCLCLVFPLPPRLRQRLCHVFPLPPRLRQRLCHVFPLPPRLRQRLRLVLPLQWRHRPPPAIHTSHPGAEDTAGGRRRLMAANGKGWESNHVDNQLKCPVALDDLTMRRRRLDGDAEEEAAGAARFGGAGGEVAPRAQRLVLKPGVDCL